MSTGSARYSASILEDTGTERETNDSEATQREPCLYRHSGTFGYSDYVCVRENWRDYERCIWHASIDQADEPKHLYRGEAEGVKPIQRKPYEELKAARRDGFERLDGARLQGSMLADIDFSECTMAGARFDGAQIRWAEDTDIPVPHASNVDNPREELRSPTFHGTSLVGAVFAHADFPTADFREADLRGADMTDSGFAFARFDEVKLYFADCTAAFFGWSEITDTNFESADCTDAIFLDTEFQGGSLENTNLTRANLNDATFHGTKLYGSVLADVRVNTNTEFGGHYPHDVDKAAWTFVRIEEISRRNALPEMFRWAYTNRKDRRRNDYWHHSKIPYTVRRIVSHLKSGPMERILQRKRVQEWVGIERNDSIRRTTRRPKQDESIDQDDGVVDSWEQWKNTAKWIWAALTGFGMRYGESPRRVVGVSLLTIVGFSLVYPFVGGFWDHTTRYQLASIAEIASPTGGEVLLRSLYFSTITFTTIGYANVWPMGAGSRVLVGVESFAGALLMATLVFVLGRRSTR